MSAACRTAIHAKVGTMRNLLGRLLERPADDLNRIARFWDVELQGRDRFADVAALYRNMIDIWSARDAWDQLDEQQRTVVRSLAGHDGAAVTPAIVASDTGIDETEANNVLRRLYTVGIVSVEADDPELHFEARDPELFLPREIGFVLRRIDEEYVPAVASGETIDELISTVPYPEIEEAAGLWGAKVTPGVHARAELVNIVRENLERPERVSRYVNNLSGVARDVWARLKAAEGGLSLDDAFAGANISPQARRRVLRELANPLLVWHAYTTGPNGLIRVLRIPDAVLHPVRAEPPPVPDLVDIDDSDVSEPIWVFPYAAVWDILTILRDVAHGSPRWRALTEGDPAIQRRFRGKLWRAELGGGGLPTGYVEFLVQVAASIGVLRDESGHAVPGNEAKGFRESAFSTATQRIVNAWTAMESWPEGKERVDLALWGASWPAFRVTLIEALGEFEEDRWYDEAQFIQRLLQSEPDLLRQAHVGAVGQTQMAINLDVPDTIDDRRARILTLVIGTTLETACVWLGLIERGRNISTHESALRLTAVGRWIAARDRSEPTLPVQGEAPLAVGANLQVLLYRPTPYRVWALSAFAELQTLDRVSTYNLTAQALIRSLSSGIDLEDVTRFLERMNGQLIPQNVAYTLAEWDRGYRRVWLRRAVVLVPDEGEEPDRIAAALKDAGLDPEIQPDGRITLTYDVPDAGERLYSAATRALRERGFAPLTQPGSLEPRGRKARQGD
jgi:hypothetical protein